MKLSILICTMPSRSEMLKKLTQQLMLLLVKYDESQWEVLIQPDENINVGCKRNILLQKASGDFVVFIDDDDEIHDNYIDAFMNAIESNPNADCIGYRGYITFDGTSRKDWVISITCKTWYEENGVYYRTPNHISPVKRSIAMQVMFPQIDFGADYEYSMGILPLLKEEVFIDEQLYHYKFMAK
jgi:glycosyltransferase involved in cell wall biosynthesis